MKRIVIPTEDSEGKKLAGHFGHAAFFALLELDNANRVVSRKTERNTGTHMGGQGFAHDNVLALKPDAIIVSGMGPRGLTTFRSQGIAVLQANSLSVDDIVAAYSAGKLYELTEGCHDAHHE